MLRIVVVKDSKIRIAHLPSQESEVLLLYPGFEIGRYTGSAKPGAEIDATKYTKLRDPITAEEAT